MSKRLASITMWGTITHIESSKSAGCLNEYFYNERGERLDDLKLVSISDEARVNHTAC